MAQLLGGNMNRQLAWCAALSMVAVAVACYFYLDWDGTTEHDRAISATPGPSGASGIASSLDPDRGEEANSLREVVEAQPTIVESDSSEVPRPDNVSSATGHHEATAGESIRTPQQVWEDEFAGAPAYVLQAAIDDLDKTISRMKAGPLDERYDLGMIDEQGRGSDIPVGKLWEQDKIMNVVVAPYGDQYFKVVLPREEYPDLYALNDKKLWLSSEILKRE